MLRKEKRREQYDSLPYSCHSPWLGAAIVHWGSGHMSKLGAFRLNGPSSVVDVGGGGAVSAPAGRYNTTRCQVVCGVQTLFTTDSLTCFGYYCL